MERMRNETPCSLYWIVAERRNATKLKKLTVLLRWNKVAAGMQTHTRLASNIRSIAMGSKYHENDEEASDRMMQNTPQHAIPPTQHSECTEIEATEKHVHSRERAQ